MVYRKEKDENGNVRDKNGERYILSECNVAYTPQGVNVGYTEFDSREACYAEWGLEDIPEEELFPEPPVEDYEPLDREYEI